MSCFIRVHRKHQKNNDFTAIIVLTALTMLIALCVDWLVGWPDPVYRRIGHPVTWMGKLIAGSERLLNRPSLPRRFVGTLVALCIITVVAVVGYLLTAVLPVGLLGAVLAGFLAWPLVAARSMFDHVEAVRLPLASGALPEARQAVSMIVGRDPEMLDEAGVSRAAIESLAENTSDGIVAPLFWGVVFGLPGIAAYKAINTLDSMVGHRTDRYLEFGWAAARIDDISNLIPARLTGGLFALAARSREAIEVMRRDARLHRSPNAGWPEAAMAGALDVRLSGPRGYGGKWSDEPWVNAEARDPGPADIGRALSVYKRTLLILCGALIVLAAI